MNIWVAVDFQPSWVDKTRAAVQKLENANEKCHEYINGI